ncbi:extracellular calcium-sensing receptor [Conger conger]|uniref:extracellular calcium-sensing receptor n=1 Tax=Conger conger TaxID=82655 RepID=UPI002A5986AE|nr:extracellular calcium-sensing receptor [Conger conger]
MPSVSTVVIGLQFPLVLLVLSVEGLGTEPVCQRLGDFDLPMLEVSGDILIGGLFPLHFTAPEHYLSYVSKPRHYQCHGFDYRAFRWVQTMVFAIEEINRDSSLLPGVHLGYRILDSCDHIHTGLRGALSLLNDSSSQASSNPRCPDGTPVSAIIGLASSSPTRVVAHTVGPFGIPMVSYFATCTCLNDKETFPSFMRTVPSDLFQVRGLVRLVSHFGWRWVGAVGTEDDYSQYGIQAFSEQLHEHGGCLAFYSILPKTHSPERISQIADILEASSARVVIVFSTEGQLYELLVEVVRRNLTGRQWVASEAWVTATLLSVPQFHPILTGALGFAFRSGSIPGLGDFLLQTHPSPRPESIFVNMFWEELFSCRLSFRDDKAQTRARPVLPACTGTEDLGTKISIYTDVSQLRVSYNVYKAVYAIAHALHTLLQCDHVAQATGIRACFRGPQFKPRELLFHLRRVNFTNQLGEKVHFDSNGEPVPLYDIINWQLDGRGGIKFEKVGSFDASAPERLQLNIDEELIVWPGGQNQAPVSVCTKSCPPGTRQATRKGEPICCFDCLPCAGGEVSNRTDSTECTKCPQYYWSNRERVTCVASVEDFLSFQESMGIILVALSLLGVTMTLVISVIFYHFRATAIVKANNSELSFLLLQSLTLCFLCALVFVGRPSKWSCWLRQVAFGVSFVLCISCILVKTIVVLVAFRSTLPGSSTVKLFGPLQQRAVILACTAVQVILCAGWLVWTPPYPFKNTSYEAGKIILECKVGSTVGFYLVLGYIGLLSCVCFALAFLGRKLPDTFNEAKLITFSMLIFFAVWISFIPAYQTSPGKYAVAVEIFAILASSFGLLLCIFLPKCYIILLRPERNTKKSLVHKPTTTTNWS